MILFLILIGFVIWTFIVFYFGTKFGWKESEDFYRKENKCYDEDCPFNKIDVKMKFK